MTTRSQDAKLTEAADKLLQSKGQADRVVTSLSEEAMVIWGKVDLSKDQRAEQLAKIAIGWDSMTTEQKMDNTKVLIARAQQIKETL